MDTPSSISIASPRRSLFASQNKGQPLKSALKGSKGSTFVTQSTTEEEEEEEEECNDEDKGTFRLVSIIQGDCSWGNDQKLYMFEKV